MRARPHPSRRFRGRPRLLLALVAIPVLLLALAQAILPSLAADRVRSKASRYGHVLSVKVSAWPAIELLWGKAGSAEVRASHMTLSPVQLSQLLWEARGVDSLTVTGHAVTLRLNGFPHGVTLEDVAMHKRGAQILAHASLTQAGLDAALPAGFRVQPLGAGPEGVQARASGGLFGTTTSLAVLVKAAAGRLVAQPEGVPFASLATVTLFAAPHLHVQRVGMIVTSRQPSAYRLSLAMSLG
jgi:hypothetical protein